MAKTKVIALRPFAPARDVVLVIGGTVLTEGQRGRSPRLDTLRELLEHDAGASEQEEIVHVFPRPKDSADISPMEWIEIFAAMETIAARRSQSVNTPQSGGVIGLTGSDTAEHQALVVDLESVLRGWDERMVLVVSHAPTRDKSADARGNYKLAKQILRDSTLPPGVYVPVGTKIHAGVDVTKLSTKPGADGSYFHSAAEPLGSVVDGQLSWDVARLEARRENASRMRRVLAEKAALHPPKNFGYVEHIVVNRRTPIEVYHTALRRALLQKNEDTQVALVLQGRIVHWLERDAYFHLDPHFVDDFRLFLDVCHANDVLVYTGSRSVACIINQRRVDHELALPADFVNAPLKLLPRRFQYTKAQTKLSWLLRYFSPEDAAHFMCQDIAGELQLPTYFSGKFTHFYPGNSPDEGIATVVAFPGMTVESFRDPARSLFVIPQLKTPELFVYGFGDGSLPLREHSVRECLMRAAHEGSPNYLRRVSGILMADEILRDSDHEIKLTGTDTHSPTILLQVKMALLSLNTGDRRKLLSQLDINPKAAFSFVHRWNALHPRGKISPPRLGETSAITLLPHFDLFAEELAKRVIKDLLMAANPILFELGSAVDRGVKVTMRTHAHQSRADLTLYELGNLAYAVGVGDGVNPPWIRRLFIPRDSIEH